MQVQTRKDATRSRRAILDSARELFRDDAEVSFAEIAHNAGVGQATVYRHFTDRRALLTELAEEDLDRLEERVQVEPIGPGSLEALLREMVADQVRSQGQLVAIQAGEADQVRVARLVERTTELFEPRLAAAQAAGLARTDLDADDMIVALGMIHGALQGRDQAGRRVVAEKVIAIVLDGIRSEP